MSTEAAREPAGHIPDVIKPYFNSGWTHSGTPNLDKSLLAELNGKISFKGDICMMTAQNSLPERQ